MLPLFGAPPLLSIFSFGQHDASSLDIPAPGKGLLPPDCSLSPGISLSLNPFFFPPGRYLSVGLVVLFPHRFHRGTHVIDQQTSLVLRTSSVPSLQRSVLRSGRVSFLKQLHIQIRESPREHTYLLHSRVLAAVPSRLLVMSVPPFLSTNIPPPSTICAFYYAVHGREDYRVQHNLFVNLSLLLSLCDLC